MKTLQFQLSNGVWMDAKESDVDDLLSCVVVFSKGISSIAEAVEVMSAGKILRNNKDYWYSNCRMIDKAAEQQRRDNYAKAVHDKNKSLKRCVSCGQEGFAGSYPFSTIADGGECDDCI